MPKPLEIVLTFIFNFYYKRKEAFRNRVLDFILDNKKGEERETISEDDLGYDEEEDQEEYLDEDINVIPQDWMDSSNKIITMYMPSSEGNTVVATFPVNKYLARILDSDDFQHEPFLNGAMREVIETCVEAKNFAEENPIFYDDEDEDDDLYT